MADLDRTALATRTARELGLTATTDGVAGAVDAAVALACNYCGLVDLPGGDPTVTAGVVTLAVRVYLDPRSPAGVLGSDSYAGAYIPEDLLTHVHGYFDHLRTSGSFGVA